MSKSAEASRRWRLRHPIAAKKQRDAYRNNPKNRTTIRNANLMWEYGISLEQYDEMLAEQHGVCFLCRRAETRIIKGKLIKLSVDHDHKTGQIRRLLCSNCNAAIGLLDECPDRARALAAYIESFREEEKA